MMKQDPKGEDNQWRTPAFRQSVVQKINEGIIASGTNSTKNAMDMESHVFLKARNKDEYLGFVARLILHVREMKNRNTQGNADVNSGGGGGPGGSGTPDPINALQNMASPGTRNQQNMMGMGVGPGGAVNMGGPGNVPASNLLQNLTHNQQQPQQGQMVNRQGQMMQQIGPMSGNMGQQGGNMVNTGPGGPVNQMNPNGMNPGNINMGIVGGGMPFDPSSKMNQMGGGMSNAMMQQMGGGGNQMNLNQGGGMVVGGNNQNQMVVGGGGGNNPQMGQMGGQMGPMSMQTQIVNQMGLNPNQMNQNQPGNMAGAMNVGGMSVNQMQANQMGQMVNANNAGGMVNVSQMQQQQQQQQQQQPNQMGVMGQQQPGGMVQQNQLVGAGGGGVPQMGSMAMNTGMQQQLIQRKPEMMVNNPGNIFQGVRNVTPTPFVRQSPSPSVPSPGMNPNMQCGTMIPSPALVPSPGPHNQMMSNQQRSVGSVMAPSPSSNLNTPGQPGSISSPLNNPQEEQLYREKYRQLTKYIEPLKRMIARMGNDDVEKLFKMNRLLDILCNPTRRIPLETLVKCERALEKIDFKSNVPMPIKEHQTNNPLLEAVSATLQSQLGNHTLQRTFKPCLEAMFGPDIKNIPPAEKRPRFSLEDQPSSTGPIIPHTMQGEIARLDQKFKVSIDTTVQPGTKTIKLICCLDDKHLPCVPPVTVSIPEDYPDSAPNCNIIEQEYSASPFLASVQKALTARISKLPPQYSLSHLLDTWEMSVRQACSPNSVTASQATVLLGI